MNTLDEYEEYEKVCIDTEYRHRIFLFDKINLKILFLTFWPKENDKYYFGNESFQISQKFELVKI